MPMFSFWKLSFAVATKTSHSTEIQLLKIATPLLFLKQDISLSEELMIFRIGYLDTTQYYQFYPPRPEMDVLLLINTRQAPPLMTVGPQSNKLSHFILFNKNLSKWSMDPPTKDNHSTTHLKATKKSLERLNYCW